MGRISAWILLSLLIASSAEAMPRRGLNQSEAETLLAAYLGPAEANWGREVSKPQGGFYRVTTINPTPRAEGFDFYDVDARTGDVWYSNICQRLNNARLRIAQRRVWRGIGMTLADYRRLRRSGQMCG